MTRRDPVGDQPGRGRGLGDAVRLGRDQHAERGREQPRSTRSTTASASTQHRNARIAIVEPIAQRRPWLNRSRNGPISGATIANGSIVRPRNSATWPRASPVGHLEEQRAGQRDRHRGVAGGVERVQLDQPGQPESPAPSAWEARRAHAVRRPAGAGRARGPPPRAPRPPARATRLALSPAVRWRRPRRGSARAGPRHRCVAGSGVLGSAGVVMQPSCPVRRTHAIAGDGSAPVRQHGCRMGHNRAL